MEGAAVGVVLEIAVPGVDCVTGAALTDWFSK